MDAFIISVGNQKGGVGKSTITSLIANYIHYKTDQTVLVIDADDKQQTLKKMRDRDMSLGYDEKELYDLLTLDSTKVKNVITEILSEYDYIFIDLPGNLKQQGVIDCYMMVDTLAVPTSVTFADIDATMDFVKLYKEKIVSNREKNGLDSNLFGIMAKVNPQTIEFKDFNNNKENLSIPFMDNYIPYSHVDFARNASTVEIYQNQSKHRNYDNFIKEFITRVNNNV